MMTDKADTVILAKELTIAWLGNPHTRVTADDVPVFLQSMVAAVEGLDSRVDDGAGVDAGDQEPVYTPAVSVRKSLANPDFIISMIDGRPYKALKRHLSANGLTPAEYRARYGLKNSYPMVAPNYAAARSDTAKRIGLGRKPGQTVKKAADAVVEVVTEPVKAATKRVRKGVAEAKAAAKEHLG